MSQLIKRDWSIEDMVLSELKRRGYDERELDLIEDEFMYILTNDIREGGYGLAGMVWHQPRQLLRRAWLQAMELDRLRRLHRGQRGHHTGVSSRHYPRPC